MKDVQKKRFSNTSNATERPQKMKMENWDADQVMSLMSSSNKSTIRGGQEVNESQVKQRKEHR